MIRFLSHVVITFLFSWGAHSGDCQITLSKCNHPSWIVNSLTVVSDDYDGASVSRERCMARANDYHLWCGLSSSQLVNSRFHPNPGSSVYSSDSWVRSNYRCEVENTSCPGDPPIEGVSINDIWGQNSPDLNQSVCMGRADDFYSYCGSALNKSSAKFYSGQMLMGSRNCSAIGCADITHENNISYQTFSNPSSEFGLLNIYHSSSYRNKGIVIFVHGGKWVQGSKDNMLAINPFFVEFFISKGYAVASINYRLVDHEDSPNAGYVEQATDVARAMKWLRDQQTQYNYNGSKMILYGHSAGAHLVALLNSDPQYILAEGLNSSNIKGVISSDVHNYHVPFAIQAVQGTPFEGGAEFQRELFGYTVPEQLAGSPQAYVGSMSHAPTLLLSAADNGHGELYHGLTKNAQQAYKNILLNNGYYADQVHFSDLDHSEIIKYVGSDFDLVTPEIEAFLNYLN